MKSGEFSGRSVDEAVFHGLMELGLSIDEVKIEPLQSESKGLFGIGAKMARVRLTQRQEEEDTPYIVKDVSKRQEAKIKPASTGPINENKQKKEYENTEQQNTRERESKNYKEHTVVDYDYSKDLADTHPAGIFLQGLLKNMKLKASVVAAEVEGGIRLRIDSDTKGLLIGRRGETLDAMQYITSLHVNRDQKTEKFIRVTLDTEEYRSKREDTLSRLARRQASRVRATGRPVIMEPMNPYERRILHASLQTHPYVTTYSEGEEPNRHVVIAPKR